MTRAVNTHTHHDTESSESNVLGIWGLVAVGAIAGLAVGIVGGSFHWLLLRGGHAFTQLIAQWKASGLFGLPGWLCAALLAGCCVGIARWLVSFAPSAAGSGVQHVEAVMRKEASPAPLRVLPIKFVGGLFAMIPGMALGREGPTIQMAAVIGSQCGRIFKLNSEDKFILYTAVAGAGLAVAFNAPIAGIAFVIEEVVRRITIRPLLTTLIAVATSIAVFRTFFGNTVTFELTHIPVADAVDLILCAGFGVLIGLAGALYNRNLLLGLSLFDHRLIKIPVVLKAALVGACVGMLGYFQPFWLGGGEQQIQTILSHSLGLQALLALLCARWFLGSISYAPGLPGGLFAPLLLIGACLGAIFSDMINLIPLLSNPNNSILFVLVGMAALFTAVVRAPFTGVLLIVEMTGAVSLTAAMIIAVVTATLTTLLLGSPPIYDSLRIRMIARESKPT